MRNANAATRVEPLASARLGGAERSRPVRLRFGSFELDPRSGELSSKDKKILLPWQQLQLLLMLIDHEGEIVTRDEIQKQLWGNDVIVEFDHSINQLVRKLRRTLGDSVEAPTYIETLARRGYRLKVPVAVVERPPAAVAVNEMKLLAGKLPAQWNGQDTGAPAASGRSSGLRPRRAARCPLRSPHATDEYHARLAPVVHNLSAQMLRQCVSAATPAERLDVLREVLVLVAQVLDGVPV